MLAMMMILGNRCGRKSNSKQNPMCIAFLYEILRQTFNSLGR